MLAALAFNAIVRACCLESGAALATLAFAPLGDPAARPLAVFAALAALALLAMLLRSLASRASRSMIVRFLILGVFLEPLFFSRNRGGCKKQQNRNLTIMEREAREVRER